MKNTVDLKMLFEFGSVRGKTVEVKIVINDRLIWTNNDFVHQHLLESELSLPGTIRIKVSGKNKFDTEIDSQNKITGDKYILIKSMSLNYISIPQWKIENRLWKFYDKNNNCKITNYFGQNGEGIFTIDNNDILEFWLDTMVVD